MRPDIKKERALYTRSEKFLDQHPHLTSSYCGAMGRGCRVVRFAPSASVRFPAASAASVRFRPLGFGSRASLRLGLRSALPPAPRYRRYRPPPAPPALPSLPSLRSFDGTHSPQHCVPRRKSRTVSAIFSATGTASPRMRGRAKRPLNRSVSQPIRRPSRPTWSVPAPAWPRQRAGRRSGRPWCARLRLVPLRHRAACLESPLASGHRPG